MHYYSSDVESPRRTRAWLTTRLAGAHGGFYVPLKQWQSGRSSLSFQVLRYEGWFGSMQSSQREMISEDIALAVKMCDHCSRELESGRGNARVRDLMSRCFNSSNSASRRASIGEVYEAFPEEAIRLMFGYAPVSFFHNEEINDDATVAEYVARAPRGTTIMLLNDQYFRSRAQHRRAQFLIHEFCHHWGYYGHPGTSRYGRVKVGAYKEHEILASDHKIPQEARQDDSHYTRRIHYSEARRNPYCYGLFAYWLCQ